MQNVNTLICNKKAVPGISVMGTGGLSLMICSLHVKQWPSHKLSTRSTSHPLFLRLIHHSIQLGSFLRFARLCRAVTSAYPGESERQNERGRKTVQTVQTGLPWVADPWAKSHIVFIHHPTVGHKFIKVDRVMLLNSLSVHLSDVWEYVVFACVSFVCVCVF